MEDQDKSLEENNLDQLAAAFGDRQITGSDGEMLAEETATQEPAIEETNPEEETSTPEKANESNEEVPTDEEDSESLGVDESGKRYVPEKRLKKETAKRREAERLAKARDEKIRSLEAALFTQNTQPVRQEPVSTRPVSPADDVETEVLFTKYPQFDPESDQYSEAMDSLGAEIYKANPGISRIAAARKAIQRAKEITSDSAKVIAEARTVKAQQSDQGITSRVLNRSTQAVDPNKMSLEEKEEWMKANGQW